MKVNKLYIFVFMFFLTGSIMAQQDPNYTFYRYSMNLVNPAYAGAANSTEFAASVRSQWSGVAGAPETQSFFASTNIGSKVGLGASIINDKTFIETQTSVAIDFSYLVKWSENANIYFGLKASGNSYNANTSGLTTFGIGSDPSLMDLNGGVNPNIGAGVYFQNRKLSLSLSLPKLLKADRLEQQGGTATVGKNKLHLYLLGAYDFEINEKLTLKPSSMIRHVESAPLSVDLTLALNFNSIIEFGASYRFDESAGGFALFNISNGLRVGYAYESNLESAIMNDANGTHEVFLKVQL
jgi:type IX secretion system PorP/SprF family membrane protein